VSTLFTDGQFNVERIIVVPLPLVLFVSRGGAAAAFKHCHLTKTHGYSQRLNLITLHRGRDDLQGSINWHGMAPFGHGSDKTWV